ncbi:MAG: hypothetical protein ABI682_11345 [Acidobacteriota bacterium]
MIARRACGRDAALREMLTLGAPDIPVPLGSSAPALMHAELGDTEEVLGWLEKALASHTRDLIYVNVEPAYDSIRRDPRFAAIIRRIGFPG